MSVELTTPADESPITLAEAKAQVRFDDDDDDALITGLIASATDWAQRFTRRQFVTATWELVLDSFQAGFSSQRPGFPMNLYHSLGQVIEIPKPPLILIDSIKYLDVDGTLQTLDPDLYVVDTSTDGGRVSPTESESWPTTQAIMNAVRIKFDAGYGDAGDVPEAIKAAIKILVAHLYEHREPVLVGTIQSELPMSAKSLLWSYRVNAVR